MGNETAKPAEDPNNDQGLQHVKANIARMDGAIRRKLRGGVQYNMKILLRGMRKSGKTSLWRRLQGFPFEAEYTPTREIQSGTINWSFKNTDEAVKVEVWDVVDKGLKEGATAEEEDTKDAEAGTQKDEDMQPVSGVLDARMVDVYKGAQACIFILDPYQRASFEYVEQMIKDIPAEMTCLILINFRDLSDSKDEAESKEAQAQEQEQDPEKDEEPQSNAPERVVTIEEVANLAHQCQQDGAGKRYVDFFEASMLNCYGLKVLYHYLSLPFLQLKKKSLEMQLEQTNEHLQTVVGELHEHISSNEYNTYIAKVRANRPEIAQGKTLSSPPHPPPTLKKQLHQNEAGHDNEEEHEDESQLNGLRGESVPPEPQDVATPSNVDAPHSPEERTSSTSPKPSSEMKKKEKELKKKKKEEERLRKEKEKEEKRKKKKKQKELDRKRRQLEEAQGSLIDQNSAQIDSAYDFKLNEQKTNAILDNFFSESENSASDSEEERQKTSKGKKKRGQRPAISSDSDSEFAGYSFGLKAVSAVKKNEKKQDTIKKNAKKPSRKSKGEKTKEKASSSIKDKSKDIPESSQTSSKKSVESKTDKDRQKSPQQKIKTEDDGEENHRKSEGLKEKMDNSNQERVREDTNDPENTSESTDKFVEDQYKKGHQLGTPPKPKRKKSSDQQETTANVASGKKRNPKKTSGSGKNKDIVKPEERSPIKKHQSVVSRTGKDSGSVEDGSTQQNMPSQRPETDGKESEETKALTQKSQRTNSSKQGINDVDKEPSDDNTSDTEPPIVIHSENEKLQSLDDSETSGEERETGALDSNKNNEDDSQELPSNQSDDARQVSKPQESEEYTTPEPSSKELNTQESKTTEADGANEECASDAESTTKDGKKHTEDSSGLAQTERTGNETKSDSDDDGTHKRREGKESIQDDADADANESDSENDGAQESRHSKESSKHNVTADHENESGSENDDTQKRRQSKESIKDDAVANHSISDLNEKTSRSNVEDDDSSRDQGHTVKEVIGSDTEHACHSAEDHEMQEDRSDDIDSHDNELGDEEVHDHIDVGGTETEKNVSDTEKVEDPESGRDKEIKHDSKRSREGTIHSINDEVEVKPETEKKSNETEGDEVESESESDQKLNPSNEQTTDGVNSEDPKERVNDTKTKDEGSSVIETKSIMSDSDDSPGENKAEIEEIEDSGAREDDCRDAMRSSEISKKEIDSKPRENSDLTDHQEDDFDREKEVSQTQEDQEDELLKQLPVDNSQIPDQFFEDDSEISDAPVSEAGSPIANRSPSQSDNEQRLPSHQKPPPKKKPERQIEPPSKASVSAAAQAAIAAAMAAMEHEDDPTKAPTEDMQKEKKKRRKKKKENDSDLVYADFGHNPKKVKKKKKKKKSKKKESKRKSEDDFYSSSEENMSS